MSLTGFAFRPETGITGLEILAKETLTRVSYEKVEQKVKQNE